MNEELRYLEFKTVRASLKESNEKDDAYAQAESVGTPMPSAFNEQDYFGNIVLDMSTVVDWAVGKVLMNRDLLPCVYPRLSDHSFSGALVISGDTFKELFEEYKGIKVKSIEGWKS